MFSKYFNSNHHNPVTTVVHMTQFCYFRPSWKSLISVQVHAQRSHRSLTSHRPLRRFCVCFGQVLALLGTWLAASLCYEIINNSVILELMFSDRPQDSVGSNSTILISYLIPQYDIINTHNSPFGNELFR